MPAGHVHIGCSTAASRHVPYVLKICSVKAIHCKIERPAQRGSEQGGMGAARLLPAVQKMLHLYIFTDQATTNDEVFLQAFAMIRVDAAEERHKAWQSACEVIVAAILCYRFLQCASGLQAFRAQDAPPTRKRRSRNRCQSSEFRRCLRLSAA